MRKHRVAFINFVPLEETILPVLFYRKLRYISCLYIMRKVSNLEVVKIFEQVRSINVNRRAHRVVKFRARYPWNVHAKRVCGTRKCFHTEDWAIYDWQNTTWMETDGVNRIYIIFVQSQVHVTVLRNLYRELRRVLLSRSCNGTYEC